MTTRIETTNMESTKNVQAQRPGTAMALVRTTLLAMTASSAANVVLYAGAGLLIPSVTAWPGAGIGQIIGATIVYLLIGTTVCYLVGRFSSRPRRLFWTLATAGLVLSMWLPLGAALGYGAPGMATPGVATAVTLGLMHVVSYVISVPLYAQYLDGKHSTN